MKLYYEVEVAIDEDQIAPINILDAMADALERTPGVVLWEIDDATKVVEDAAAFNTLMEDMREQDAPEIHY